DLGNHRDTAADGEDEQYRSPCLAHSDPRAHCQRLVEQQNRRAHAVELRRLNGLSLPLTKACRKTAVNARRIALQLIQNTIIAAPDVLRDQLRRMTRMQLVRLLAAWRPDLTAYRDVEAAYRITLKSLGRRYLELHDEIADLDMMIADIFRD